MAHHLDLQQLGRLRSNSRRLAQQAATNESDIQLLLDTAQADLRNTYAARRLCLRAQQHRLTADRLVNDLADAETTAQPDRRRAAILVVDDHRDSRESLAMLLSGAGFLVRTAANGLEAVLAAYEVQPAVIVMDLMMPVLDGIEATRLIRAIDELRDASVIAYSATPPGPHDKTAALFSAVLRKPSSPDVVIATVQQFADRPA